MQKRTNRTIGETAFAAIGTALYALVNGALLLFHEPWRDEAQAWLITRDLNLPGILRQIKFEGQPILWNLVLLPFAKLGFPYRWIGVVSLLLTSAAVYLLLKDAPIPRAARLLTVLGGQFMYFTPVIARCYALIPLCLMLIVISFRRRREKPLLYAASLALLPQTHIIMAGFAGMLMLFFVLEEAARIRKREGNTRVAAAGICMIFVGGLLLLWQMSGSLAANQSVHAALPWKHGFVEMVYDLCVEYTRTVIVVTGAEFLHYDDPSRRVSLLLVALTAAWILLWSRRHRKPALALGAGLAFQTVIYTFVFVANAQRAMTSVGMLMCCVFLAREEPAREAGVKPGVRTLLPERWGAGTLALTLASALSIGGWFPVARADVNGVFSYSLAAAEYIENELPKNAVIIGDEESLTAAAAAYFPLGKFYNLQRGEAGSFATWDEIWAKPYTLSDIVSHVSETPGYPERPCYALISRDAVAEPVPGATLLHTFAGDPLARESYRLYALDE